MLLNVSYKEGEKLNADIKIEWDQKRGTELELN